MHGRLLLIILLMLWAWDTYSQDQWKNVYSEKAWAARDTWQRADEIIRELNLKKDSKVADVGCHEGYMTLKLCRVVPSGSVYAVDVDQARLDKLKTILSNRVINNVEVIKGEYSDPRLPASQLNAVLIVDTYHEMSEHDKILQHIKAALKPGGRLVISEPIADERKNQTRAQQESKHELGLNYAADDLKKAGFTIVKMEEAFVDRTKEKGDKMWLLVAEK